jgi:hypothetical protein
MKIYLSVLCMGTLSIGLARADRTVWYVHPDSALNTIQAGLDSCADNDIVLVAPGTYAGGIIWPNRQGVSLVSEMGSEVTIVSYGSPVIQIIHPVDTSTVIHGFTIRDGMSPFMGGGIFCDAASPLIVDNIIRNNLSQGNGGGIACCGGASPVVRNNDFIENACHDDAAAIYYDNGCKTFLYNNTFYSNYAGGILSGVWCGDSAIIIGNNFDQHNYESIWCSSGSLVANNTISTTGAGIVSYGSVLISDNTMTDCLIAIRTYGQPDDTIEIKKCNISDQYYRWGTGIYCSGGNVVIDSCSVQHPSTGLEIKAGTVVNMHDSSVDSCTTGVLCSGCTFYADSCTIARGMYGIYCIQDTIPSFIDVHFCNIFSHSLYGAYNEDASSYFNAEYNWWGDSTGPYHPDSNPGGLGDPVSDYVDFIPWLYWPGVEEQPTTKPVVKYNTITSTIFAGPLLLPEDKNCKVIDIAGREIHTLDPAPGIYFIEVDGEINQKVIKIK